MEDFHFFRNGIHFSSGKSWDAGLYFRIRLGSRSGSGHGVKGVFYYLPQLGKGLGIARMSASIDSGFTEYTDR